MKRMICLVLAGLLAVCMGCAPAQEENPPEQMTQKSDSTAKDALPTYDVLLPTLPEGVEDGDLTLVQLPDRQQYAYEGTVRLVLEVMEPGADETLAETEAETAGEKTVAAYVFSAGDIQYPGLSDGVPQRWRPGAGMDGKRTVLPALRKLFPGFAAGCGSGCHLRCSHGDFAGRSLEKNPTARVQRPPMPCAACPFPWSRGALRPSWGAAARGRPPCSICWAAWIPPLPVA